MEENKIPIVSGEASRCYEMKEFFVTILRKPNSSPNNLAKFTLVTK
jgi:hypothetical protein